MSDDVLKALIVGLTTSVPATISAYFAYRAAVISKKTEENTNHLKDELVDEVRKAAYAAGRKHEKEDRL